MNICVCIPARYKSSRLQKKLLLPIKDKTIIEHTYLQVIKSKYISEQDIFLITDHKNIKNVMEKCMPKQNIIFEEKEYLNGTERIANNIHKINSKYNIIINVQGDEPFINFKNIDFLIEKYLQYKNENIFLWTLKQHIEKNQLNNISFVKVITDLENNVCDFTRKNDNLEGNNNVYISTGIYLFEKYNLLKYIELDDTSRQKSESIEQLKVLEHNYKMKSFLCPFYNEISINTKQDYEYLLKKYN